MSCGRAWDVAPEHEVDQSPRRTRSCPSSFTTGLQRADTRESLRLRPRPCPVLALVGVLVGVAIVDGRQRRALTSPTHARPTRARCARRRAGALASARATLQAPVTKLEGLGRPSPRRPPRPAGTRRRRRPDDYSTLSSRKRQNALFYYGEDRQRYSANCCRVRASADLVRISCYNSS
jgi:hypothetical protein